MPLYLSHLLQPLDIGCFGPLKRAYGGLVLGVGMFVLNYTTPIYMKGLLRKKGCKYCARN
ncbi:hypothetical protein BDV19DRAFT_366433 [Aspergillus venezuelensis]